MKLGVGRSCDRHYRGFWLLPSHVTVGFRPQLHAAAAIAAQTEPRLCTIDKKVANCNAIKTNNWNAFVCAICTQIYLFITLSSAQGWGGEEILLFQFNDCEKFQFSQLSNPR